jgi:hypothetical protein
VEVYPLKKVLAALLLATSLAHAQDKNSLKDLEGTWDLNDAQLRVELKSDQMRLYLEAEGQMREIRVPYQSGINEISTGSYLSGRMSSYRPDEAKGHLSMSIDCRGQGTPTTTKTGMLDNLNLQINFQRPVGGHSQEFRLFLSESVREGTTVKSYRKTYSTRKKP